MTYQVMEATSLKSDILETYIPKDDESEARQFDELRAAHGYGEEINTDDDDAIRAEFGFDTKRD